MVPVFMLNKLAFSAVSGVFRELCRKNKHSLLPERSRYERLKDENLALTSPQNFNQNPTLLRADFRAFFSMV